MVEKYTWSTQETLDLLDKNKLGERLVELLAKKLKKKEGLYYVHRDYCGHGLDFVDGKYRLLVVHDGYPDSMFVLKDWASEQNFISFFAEQSDWSMSGVDESNICFIAENMHGLNNQRLTRKRIENYVNDVIDDN